MLDARERFESEAYLDVLAVDAEQRQLDPPSPLDTASKAHVSLLLLEIDPASHCQKKDFSMLFDLAHSLDSQLSDLGASLN